jgi:hypothetical protein
MGTKRQMVERVEAVAQLRLQGKEYAEIAQFCAAQGWPHGVRQTYLYIRRADALLARYVETNRQSLFGQRIARRNALWSQALEQGKLELALQIERDQSQLLGFYPPRNAPTPPTAQVQVNNVTPPCPPRNKRSFAGCVSPDSARSILQRLPFGRTLPTGKDCLPPDQILWDAGMMPDNWRTQQLRKQCQKPLALRSGRTSPSFLCAAESSPSLRGPRGPAKSGASVWSAEGGI